MTATMSPGIAGGRQDASSIKTDEEVRVIPYIKQINKEALAAGCPIETPGNLTYLIQQLLRRYWKNSQQNYQAIAEILGSIQGARFDFEQRIVKDYERLKCEANGDVW